MKRCKQCGVEKDMTEFYKHKQMADGYLNFCKACFNEKSAAYRKTDAGKASKRREQIKHADKYRAWKRAYKKSEKGKLNAKRYVRAEIKRRAKDAINNALKRSDIVIQPCFICGEKAQAHHSSYAEDMHLCVTWLCQKHHNQLHIEHARSTVTVTNLLLA